MKKVLLAVLYSIFLSFSVCFAQQTRLSANDEVFVTSALANTQQWGNFYFIPFTGNPGIRPRHYDDYFRTRTEVAQSVVLILGEFEKRKNLSVTSFTIERDPREINGDGGTASTIHGIFIKAVPKSPPSTPAKK